MDIGYKGFHMPFEACAQRKQGITILPLYSFMGYWIQRVPHAVEGVRAEEIGDNDLAPILVHGAQFVPWLRE